MLVKILYSRRFIDLRCFPLKFSLHPEFFGSIFVAPLPLEEVKLWEHDHLVSATKKY